MGGTRGAGGWHVNCVAEDGEDVEDFAQRLRDRLMLAGWIWGEVSKFGSILYRTLIDYAATAPSRIIYEADAVLAGGLAYKEGARRPRLQDGGSLNTRIARAFKAQARQAIEASPFDASSSTK